MNRIRELRVARKWRQDELAEALNTKRQSISRYENEERGLDVETICKLCEIFGCSADYLLGRSPLPSPSLDPAEEELLLAWRSADDHDRRIVSAALGLSLEDAAHGSSSEVIA